mmetsp:Transcript_43770/g.103098  ORF Transcript_43770/g.103098 Transcript_43770/m.103098 type:complete len:323 (+) Transcript_43770:61-1029(+)|eukprot:CAMPEP_0180215876 /NCGR_PEP_ID=MMETSP0987-20121128/15813_1 /TAXON_ID=697907 /ORGANISM="non described non described, Strain CCMP2293" /LENGTH=322 /DNA_ID=CAMNT_0022174731 /DNA_START=150 /DNA_END=1118 /DNA_ORIENTATION=+
MAKGDGENGLYAQPKTVDGPNKYLGTFSTMSFVSVGAPFGIKPPADGGTRRVGRQLQVPYPKKDTYFTAEYPLLGGVYQETQPTRYRITQPRDKRKSGFLSQDASKRDVCMNMTMNTIQNQTIIKEERANRASRNQLVARQAELGLSGRQSAPPNLPTNTELLKPFSPQTTEKKKKKKKKDRPVTHDLSLEDTRYIEGKDGPEFVFDIGRGAETSFCPRSRREKWYEPRMHCGDTTWSRGERVVQGYTKRFGTSSTMVSSREIGLLLRQPESVEAHPDHDASPFGRRSILANQMSRTCGALLPPFNNNAISAAGPVGSILLL